MCPVIARDLGLHPCDALQLQVEGVAKAGYLEPLLMKNVHQPVSDDDIRAEEFFG